ncbi:MAG: ribonuclease P protein component [Siculibacillus sp.]|nr:ribonuclease P protein component [Siculibacillus sp.]
MKRLKRRAEFLAVARGVRSARRAFVLQTLRLPDETDEPRCGFTVSKKVGNAVVRNRVRRRLKEAIRLDADDLGRPGFDHVVIGRREALAQPFADLRADLAGAFRQGRKDRRGREAAATTGEPVTASETSHRDARGETPGRTR